MKKTIYTLISLYQSAALCMQSSNSSFMRTNGMVAQPNHTHNIRNQILHTAQSINNNTSNVLNSTSSITNMFKNTNNLHAYWPMASGESMELEQKIREAMQEILKERKQIGFCHLIDTLAQSDFLISRYASMHERRIEELLKEVGYTYDSTAQMCIPSKELQSYDVNADMETNTIHDRTSEHFIISEYDAQTSSWVYTDSIIFDETDTNKIDSSEQRKEAISKKRKSTRHSVEPNKTIKVIDNLGHTRVDADNMDPSETSTAQTLRESLPRQFNNNNITSDHVANTDFIEDTTTIAGNDLVLQDSMKLHILFELKGRSTIEIEEIIETLNQSFNQTLQANTIRTCLESLGCKRFISYKTNKWVIPNTIDSIIAKITYDNHRNTVTSTENHSNNIIDAKDNHHCGQTAAVKEWIYRYLQGKSTVKVPELLEAVSQSKQTLYSNHTINSWLKSWGCTLDGRNSRSFKWIIPETLTPSVKEWVYNYLQGKSTISVKEILQAIKDSTQEPPSSYTIKNWLSNWGYTFDGVHYKNFKWTIHNTINNLDPVEDTDSDEDEDIIDNNTCVRIYRKPLAYWWVCYHLRGSTTIKLKNVVNAMPRIFKKYAERTVLDWLKSLGCTLAASHEWIIPDIVKNFKNDKQVNTAV